MQVIAQVVLAAVVQLRQEDDSTASQELAD